MRSRVIPGSSPTIDRRLFVNRLNSVDLPTLGRPTMATSGSASAPGRAGITDLRYVGKAFSKQKTALPVYRSADLQPSLDRILHLGLTHALFQSIRRPKDSAKNPDGTYDGISTCRWPPPKPQPEPCPPCTSFSLPAAFFRVRLSPTNT